MHASQLLRGLFRLFVFVTLACGAGWIQAEEATGNQTPEVVVVGSGPLVPRGANQAIPISFKNLSQVDVEILKVTDAHGFLNDYYLTDHLSGYSLDSLSKSFESVFSDRFTLPKGKPDQFNPARLPVPRELDSGWYVVVVRAPGSFTDLQVRHLLLTDLGIQARVHRNSATFSVSRLSDGQLIHGARVELYRQRGRMESLITDADGRVTFSRPIERQDIIVAYSNDGRDMALLPMREAPLDLSEFQVGGRIYQPTEAYLYSNRDLVKPGESLPVNVLLRDQDGKAITNQPLTLVVTNPRSDEVLRQRLEPQAAGFLSYQIRTASDWPTGRYTVQVMLDPTSKEAVGELKFQLEEFVPERMELVTEGGDDWVAAGSSNWVTLKGRYLFGSPAAGNRVLTDVTMTPVRHFLSGPYTEYSVGESFRLRGRYQQLQSKVMSDEGSLELPLPTPEAEQLLSPVKVEASFSLEESGGAAVQRQYRFVSWLDVSLPGIRPASDSFSYGSLAEFELALLSADGQSLKSGELDLELRYNRGPYYWVYEEGSGWSRKEQERWVTKASRSVKLAGDAVQVGFPVEWGDYQLIATDRASGRRTVLDFYAGWYQGYRQLKAKPDHLAIDSDKSRYLAGDTAKVSLNAPIQGDLLLTLETDRVIWTHSQSVDKGEVNIEVPIDAGLARHDIYLTATLTASKDGLPKRYFGIRPLALDRSDRQLALSLALPDRIEPLTQLVIPVEALNVADDQVDNTWVTVSIVDKGIINLSRYAPVNPFKYLFGQRRYSADLLDLFSRLYDSRPDPFAQSRFGSDDNAMADSRNDDLVESKSVILMSSPVKLAQGRGEVVFDIPDYNGEGQLVVTAFNDTQVGQLVTDKTISAAVVAELSVPRFLTPGDRSTVTVDLFNNSGEARDFQLKLVVQGGTLQGWQGTDELTLEDGERWSQSVPVTVSETPGLEAASFQLTVDGGVAPIDRSWRVPVKPLFPWVVQSSAQRLEPGETFRVGPALWQGLTPVDGKRGELQISLTPQLSVSEQARDLLRYPYGCAEQTVSKAWPFLLQHSELTPLQAGAIAKHNVEAKQPVEDAGAVVGDAVARLKSMQNRRGGFGMWSGDSHEHPWLTAYVAEFLFKAQTRYPGVVPEAMLQQVEHRLERYLSSDLVKELAYNKEGATAARAYAAYLLSQRGKVSFSELRDISLDEAPSKLADLQLAHAYAKVGAVPQAEALLKHASELRRQSGYFSDYGSTLRDSASAVLVLGALSQEPRLKTRAWRQKTELLEQLPDMAARSWVSTQERAMLLRAAVLTSEQNRKADFKVSVDGEVQAQRGPLSLMLKPEMTLSNPGRKPLYLRLMASGHLKLDPTVSNANSPFNTLHTAILSRTLYRADGTLFRGDSLKVGERLVVVLKVKLFESVHDALLVDRIPAGFVLENPNLAQGPTAGSLLPGSVILSDPEHVEYRNDRFVVADPQGEYARSYAYVLRAEVPGQFAVPPIFLESMYRPEKHLIYWQTPQTLTIER